MNDLQVLDFCHDGCLLLRSVVPDEINQLACDWLDRKIPSNPIVIAEAMTEAQIERIRDSHEPSTIFLEKWFMEHVLLNAKGCGIMSSLLGPSVGLLMLANHHRVEYLNIIIDVLSSHSEVGFVIQLLIHAQPTMVVTR